MAEILFPLFGEPFDFRIRDEMRTMDQQAADITANYDEQVRIDPEGAIKRLKSALEVVRNVVRDRAFVEAIASGPNPEYTGSILQLAGRVYPTLDKEARKIVLSCCLTFLDSLRYGVSQENVEYINEPWLVGDILVNRGLYNPGYEHEARILNENKTWNDLRPHLESARSAFWICLAITRIGFASPEIQFRFYTLFPSLTDRTKDVIAALITKYAKQDHEKTGVDFEQALNDHISSFDPQIHQDIRKKILEEKWIDLEE